ncbi:putative protein no-on-transient A isoform X2 [Iris pallida]|uniref:B box-type domain-containing protein n=1 Tax=Iris pallida TaxID=29817 RepID=A0AAX6DKI5_IRIPA|nr:putative protein no-on-transient A isoform X2 [Iris pallida]
MKKCELCSSVARLVCESDEASLCFECDAKVHGANFLVARHQRLLLCRHCQAPTTWRADGPRLGPTVSLCRRCLLHKNQRHHHDDDDDEGESRRNQQEEEEDQDDDDDDDEEGEEEEEGEEQVVPWATDEEEKNTTPPPPPVASSSSSEEESTSAAAATTATTARERNGLLKRTRENTVDLPPSPCSSFSRDRLSDRPRQQPVQTGSGCNIDDGATSDSFRPLKSRTLLRSALR